MIGPNLPNDRNPRSHGKYRRYLLGRGGRCAGNYLKICNFKAVSLVYCLFIADLLQAHACFKINKPQTMSCFIEE